MLNCFTIARALHRLIASPNPVSDGLVVKTCFCAVAGENFGMRCCDVGELTFDGRGDTAVELLASVPEQGAVRGILDQRMLEGVFRVGRAPAAEDKLGSDELRQCIVQLRLRHRRDRADRSCEKCLPKAAAICATSRTAAKRSSRASREAWSVAGIVSADSG